MVILKEEMYHCLFNILPRRSPSDTICPRHRYDAVFACVGELVANVMSNSSAMKTLSACSVRSRTWLTVVHFWGTDKCRVVEEIWRFHWDFQVEMKVVPLGGLWHSSEVGKNSWGWDRWCCCCCCFWPFNANSFTYALTLTNFLPSPFEYNRRGHDAFGFLLLNLLAYLFFSGTVTRLSMRCCVRSAVVGTPICSSLLLKLR